MKKEKLTAYDNFIINKNKDIPFEEKKESENSLAIENEPKLDFSSSYENYLKAQLRRTEPSLEKVLTQEEFERNNSEEKERCWQALVGNSKNESTSDGTIAKNVKFKKFGKILLAVYVIIMLCLALIVIVKTTSKGNLEIADAINKSEKQDGIELLEDEEKEKNNNRFDNFCDSLK